MRRYLVSALCGALFLVPLGLAAQPFPVNTATRGWQQCPAVLAHPEGGYFVLFASSFGPPGEPHGISAQRFGLSGERLGPELALATESTTCLAAVPAGPGRLLAAWGVLNLVGRQTVYARHFDFQGNPLSAKIKVGEGMIYLPPAAACDADGRCWIAWIGESVESLRARRFDAAGEPLGDEIRIDAPGEGERWDLELSADPRGGFVASWWNGSTATGTPEDPLPPPNGQVLIRRFSAGGEPLGDEFGLGSEPATFAYSDGAVCHLADGGFVAAVSRVRIDLGGPDEILLRRFDASGAPAGPERLAARSTQAPRSLGNLHLACGPDRLLLLWTERSAKGSLFGRFFGLSGEPLGAPFLVSEPGGRASALLLGPQHFLAAWEEYQSDDDGYDILGRAYRTAAAPLSLHGGRFKVEAAFRDPHTRALAPAEPRPLTDDTGLFWFFDNANLELVVKTIDGCEVNGHFWVFAAGLTDVEAEISVTDTVTGAWKTYRNPPKTAFLPIQDTRAFACP
ncbi:MAG: hypothetical protein ABUT39_07995 [Acidobacteriota bacterium]